MLAPLRIFLFGRSRPKYSTFVSNWKAPGNNHISAISTEIFKYVRIHPNFTSQPVWCEKMFLSCFSLKVGRKDLTNRPKVLSPHPPPPPPPNCSFLLKKCWIWIHKIWTPCATRLNTAKILLTSFGGTEGEWGGGGGETFVPVCQVFSQWF